MVTLSQIINQIEGLDGYVYHFLRYKDPNDLTQYYRVFIETDNYVKGHEVRILVINEGEGNEAAYIYEIPEEIDPRVPGTFKTLLNTTIDTYQTANPKLEYYEINNLDEVKNVARITGYFLNAEDKLEVKVFISFMLGENIKFREVV